MQETKPNEERARWAIVTVVIVTAMRLINSAITYLYAIDIESRPILFTSQIIGLATFGTFIFSAVFVIMWFRRAYNNLHLAGSQYLSFSEGWASGAWFVPIMNLGRPYKIMREIWNETQAIHQALQVQREIQPSTLVGWWWALYLIGNFFVNLSARESSNFDTAASLKVFGNLITATAGFLLIAIIRRVREFEREFALRNADKLQQDRIKSAMEAGQEWRQKQ